MIKTINLHEGVIRTSLVDELESFRAPARRVSSYYLNLGLKHANETEAVRRAVKATLKRAREQIDQLEVSHAARQALRHDLELVEELAPTVVGERSTSSLACFVGSDDGPAVALPLAWPVRDRWFFEDHFVVWPLQQLLDQSDRYGIVLTDKDDARLFLFFQERAQEVTDIADEIPGRIRFPDRSAELEYMRKHIEAFHHHFQKVAETTLRLWRAEPFEHLIIGGLWETLPQFEGRLHRYLRDRVVARWDIDVAHAPLADVRDRARFEERSVLDRQARDSWNTIQDYRPTRGALGPEEAFAALWRRAVQHLLVVPDVVRPGYRCTACGRLSLVASPCVECGGLKADVADVFEAAVVDAIEQDAHVRRWPDLELQSVDSIAALRRY